MPSFFVTKASDGKANLHIWRTGVSYGKQKGAIYRREWTNVYFSLLPQPPMETIYCADIRKPLKFCDGTFDAIYALHVIEHLTPKEGKTFLKELYRILKPNGICRLSTPDMENIVREYLKWLDIVWQNPSLKNEICYHWIKLELYDQLVRNKTGGAMSEAVKEGYYEPVYSRRRFRDVFDEFVPHPSIRGNDQNASSVSIAKRLKNLTPQKFLHGLWHRGQMALHYYRLKKVRRWQNNDPRKTLELNKWMYDRLSLKLILEEIGFVEYQVKSYDQSDITGWERYQLDRSTFGPHPVEPSLYVEAKKAKKESS